MTIYNIVFPFLILIALGIAVFILSRRLPEAVEKHAAPIKEEKKRWWQVLVGKGENVLRVLRVFLLKLDNKLNRLIKRVKEKKETMGENIKDYRDKHWQRPRPGNASKEEGVDQEAVPSGSIDIALNEKSQSGKIETKPLGGKLQDTKNEEQTSEAGLAKHKGFSRFAQRITSAFQSAQSKRIPVRAPGIKEIIPKSINPAELKVEKQQYWKKKEEMLIQSIVREPKNVGLYIQLGRLYSIQRNWIDARNAFLEVLKLDKTNIKAKEELKRIEKYINS